MDRMRILRLLFLFVGLFCALPLVADNPTVDELRAQAGRQWQESQNVYSSAASRGITWCVSVGKATCIHTK